MLMRWDPFRELDRVAASMLGDARGPRSMAMDAYRRGDDLYVELDLPGVDPDSIELTVERNVLTVSARRAFDRSELEEIVISERPQGVFSRQLLLGDNLDHEALTGRYDRGVLQITVPVHESSKPRRIPVTVESGDQAAIGTSAG
jgi:HSP20 family protein